MTPEQPPAPYWSADRLAALIGATRHPVEQDAQIADDETVRLTNS